MPLNLSRNYAVIELTAGGKRRVLFQSDSRQRALMTLAKLEDARRNVRLAPPMCEDPFDRSWRSKPSSRR